jgi:hypothetical protein|tara:strand:- start:3347 stop:3907 length:561 start_codon:yes stop_codon:yes gene_type:complete
MIKKLITIQNQLKASKSQYNSFGKYSYRNAEDILEALKPLLNEQGLLLTVTDKVIEVAGNMFVECTAEITDGEAKAHVTAQAGLDLNRKGMDKAQSTGASSSYARKYALGGLFLLDDTKDADATNTHGKAPAKAVVLPELSLSSEAYLKALQAVTNKTVTVAQIKGKYSLKGKVLETLTTAENSPA